MSSQDVLVRYLADSLRIVEGAMKGSQPSASSTLGSAQRRGSTPRTPGSAAGYGSSKLLDAQPRRPASDVGLRRSSLDMGSMRQQDTKQLPSKAATKLRSSSTQRMSTQLPPKAPHVNHSLPAKPSMTDLRASANRPLPGQLPRSGGAAGAKAISSSNPARGAAPVAPLNRAAVSGVAAASPHRARSSTPSEAGTHADWWRPRSSSSVLSYPMTAVTDRGGSISNTEFQNWLERISQLESLVKDEQKQRHKFEEELKQLQSDALFNVSRGGLASSVGTGGSPAPSAAAQIVRAK